MDRKPSRSDCPFTSRRRWRRSFYTAGRYHANKFWVAESEWRRRELSNNFSSTYHTRTKVNILHIAYQCSWSSPRNICFPRTALPRYLDHAARDTCARLPVVRSPNEYNLLIIITITLFVLNAGELRQIISRHAIASCNCTWWTSSSITSCTVVIRFTFFWKSR